MTTETAVEGHHQPPHDDLTDDELAVLELVGIEVQHSTNRVTSPQAAVW
jgi:hypothetical protein